MDMQRTRANELSFVECQHLNCDSHYLFIHKYLYKYLEPFFEQTFFFARKNEIAPDFRDK